MQWQIIKQQCRQLIANANALLPIIEKVPLNYVELKNCVLESELKNTVSALTTIFHKSNSLQQLQQDLKKFLFNRDLELTDTMLSFFASTEGIANTLVWDIVMIVFTPKNWQEMLALILPKVKRVLSVNVLLAEKMAFTTRLHWSDFNIKLNHEPVTSAFENTPLKLASLQQFSCHQDTVFDLQQMQFFTFAMHQKFYAAVTTNFPRLAAAIYTHNDDYERLEKDINLVEKGGKTPRTAIMELIYGLRLHGEQRTDDEFTEKATKPVGRFLVYLKDLPSELRIKVLALKGYDATSKTIDQIINRDIMEDHDCIETAADNASYVIQNSQNNETLDTLPSLTKERIIEIRRYYHKVNLNHPGQNHNQVLPEKISAAILKNYVLGDSEAFIDLLITIPTDLYKLYFTQVTIFEFPDDLHEYFENDLISPLQKQAFAAVLYQHPEIFGGITSCVKFVFETSCPMFAKAYFERYTEKDKKLALETKDMIDCFVANNANNLQVNIFFDLMGKKWFKQLLLIRKNIFKEAITCNNGPLLAALLQQYPEKDRFHQLAISGIRSQKIDRNDFLEEDENNPVARSFILPILKVIAPEHIENLLKINNYYLFHLALKSNDTDLFCTLLTFITPVKRYPIYKNIMADKLTEAFEFQLKCLPQLQKLLTSDEFDNVLFTSYEEIELSQDKGKTFNELMMKYVLKTDSPEIILFLSKIDIEKLKAYLLHPTYFPKTLVKIIKKRPLIVVEQFLKLFSAGEIAAWLNSDVLRYLLDAAIASKCLRKFDLIWQIIVTANKVNDFLQPTDDFHFLATAVKHSNVVIMEKFIALFTPNDLQLALAHKVRSPFLYATFATFSVIKRLLEVTDPDKRLALILRLLKIKAEALFYHGKMEMIFSFLTDDEKIKLLHADLHDNQTTLDIMLYFPNVFSNILAQLPPEKRVSVLEKRNALHQTTVQAFISAYQPEPVNDSSHIENFLGLLPERKRISHLNRNAYQDGYNDTTLTKYLQQSKRYNMLCKTDYVLELDRACRWYWRDLHQKMFSVLLKNKIMTKDNLAAFMEIKNDEPTNNLSKILFDIKDEKYTALLVKMNQVARLYQGLQANCSSSQKLREFRELFPIIKPILKQDEDKSTRAFIKKVLHILGHVLASVPTLGGYAIYRAVDSKIRFNTYAFWKSTEEKFVEVCEADLILKKSGWRNFG